jgi:predicted TIM-barrel fold metal-dependent hydrolase
MAIDLHAHYVPPKLAEALRQRRAAPLISREADGAELYHMPVGPLPFTTAYTDIAERISFLDAVGIDVQVLSLPGLFGIDYLPAEQSAHLVQLFNDDLSIQCQTYPGRFLGLAALPLDDIRKSVTELKRAVESLGLIGAILPNNAFLTVDHANRLAPIFDYGQSKGLHFFIHPGWRPDEYPVTGSPTGEPLEMVISRGALNLQNAVAQAMTTILYSDFLDSYPGVTIHVANLGGTFPMVVERMDHTVATRFPDQKRLSLGAKHIHVDCSSLGPRAIEIAAAVYGANNIVLGTDTPIFSAEWTLEAVKSASLTNAEKAGILSGNAASLLARWL